MIAVTRPVSDSLANCELTHLARESIDVARAARQHADYERLLVALGASLVRVAAAHELPDAVFVEDTAIVLDEIAVITRPGAAPRRHETPAVAAVLADYRSLRTMTAPATLDGGDVLRVGRTLYVGRSGRTNELGIGQLAGFVAPFGYRVTPVAFEACLHLKSAACALGDELLLLNPAAVSPAAFPGCETIAVDERESSAANALWIGDAIVYPSQYPRTRDRLAQRGLRVMEIEAGELAKAEGGVTCCSLIFEAPASGA
jgi:dimethylargininase